MTPQASQPLGTPPNCGLGSSTTVACTTTARPTMSVGFLSPMLTPAIIACMVAEQYNQEPAKVASIVLIGNFAALAFVPLGLSLALH